MYTAWNQISVVARKVKKFHGNRTFWIHMGALMVVWLCVRVATAAPVAPNQGFLVDPTRSYTSHYDPDQMLGASPPKNTYAWKNMFETIADGEARVPDLTKGEGGGMDGGGDAAEAFEVEKEIFESVHSSDTDSAKKAFGFGTDAIVDDE
jgi:hypothetical protein